MTFCGFPPLADSFEQGDSFMTLLSSAAVKISLYSICAERYTDSDILNAGSIARFVIVQLPQIIGEPLVPDCQQTEEGGLASPLTSDQTEHDFKLAPRLKGS